MNEALLLERIKQLPEDKKIELENFAESLLQKTIAVTPKKETRFGFAKGTFKVLPGFDDPIEGMEEYML